MDRIAYIIRSPCGSVKTLHVNELYSPLPQLLAPIWARFGALSWVKAAIEPVMLAR